ncbi:MAG: hypothetical protein AUG49_10965 [Catenulispora sp. 13_1_20CM_3_70_7]|nr:MAG: hypothetical protein AUG49_10965 [Catenulispora sp. 13_1_20CM_3_70_7]
MNKTELAAEVAERLNGVDPDARQYVDAVFDVIMRRVAAGERVQILGFGTFDSVERAARTGRNPRTGAEIQVPPSVSPRFHAGQTFRGQVTDGAPAPAVPEVVADDVQDVAKPAKAKKPKAVADQPAKAVAEKPAKAVAEKPAKAVAEKPAKKSKKKAAKPAEKKSPKSAKVAKKSGKADKAAKTAKAAKAAKK